MKFMTSLTESLKALIVLHVVVVCAVVDAAVIVVVVAVVLATGAVAVAVDVDVAVIGVAFVAAVFFRQLSSLSFSFYDLLSLMKVLLAF